MSSEQPRDEVREALRLAAERTASERARFAKKTVSEPPRPVPSPIIEHQAKPDDTEPMLRPMEPRVAEPEVDPPIEPISHHEQGWSADIAFADSGEAAVQPQMGTVTLVEDNVPPEAPVEQVGLVGRSSLSFRDLLSETTISLTARPARTLLTALGTILGVAALVATLGLAGTAGNQILTRFDELVATQVTVEPETGFFSGPNSRTISVIPFDADDRLQRLNGVISAGTISDVDIGDSLASSVPVNDPLGQNEFQVPVLATSAGLFDAARAQILTGRTFDAGHDERADPVAVLGPGAARRLNITQTANAPAIFIGDQPLVVVGILADVKRKPELLNAIIVPNGVARDRFGLSAPTEVLIETEVGAAELIEAQAPTALYPNAPDRLDADAPPTPTRARNSVQTDVNSLFLVLGAISLVVGAIGIANVTLVSVLERTGEIGLRRALGGTRRHIAMQFLTESAALGTIAGILGTSLGILTVVIVSATREWSPVLNPALPLVAPFLGSLIGLVAGTYPAWKAANLEPIAALRGAD